MAPATLRDSVGNLPVELTSFVGRRRELSEGKALLSSGHLVTLTGMGGVGKTRLGRRLASDVHRAFQDGVWQVELAELHEPALVAASIAAALRLAEPRGAWTIGKLQERLVGRHLLLLIDNCEHLIDACAVTVDALLRACPDLRIVATSRQPLGIDGEQTLAVAPLPTPDPEQIRDLALLDQFDATRLFLDRARSVLSGFAIDQHNRRAVAELCDRLDGLPLALEFAALRVRALSVEEIVARLDQDSRLSSSGSRIAPSRQQTLRALVDWSYQLCSEPEQVLWRRLSVFTSSFDLDALEALCAGTSAAVDLVDLVVGLVEKSVLSREDHSGQVRYRMARTIRAYGLERLIESGQENAARRSHRDWYLALTTRAFQQHAGPDQLVWFTRMRQEHGDIRAALEFSMADPDGVAAAGTMLVALLDYWVAFGFLTEGRHWLDQVVRKTPEPGLPRARALRAAAFLAAIQGDPQIAALNEARELASQANSESELAWCSFTDAALALVAGDLSTAKQLYGETTVGMRASGDIHGLACALAGHAVAAAMSEDLPVAEARAGEFLELADRLGEGRLRGAVLWALGVATYRAGDLRRAAELELESLRLRVMFDDHLGVIWSAEVLGWIAAHEGDAQTAAVLLGVASQAAAAIGTSLYSFAFLVEDHERCEARLRAELGAAAFEAAIRRGGELTAEQLLEVATGAKGQQPGSAPRGGTAAPTPPAERPASPLTRRESEIAELVADGVSNREIAARLVIAPRTAEGHVEHILVKLGFTSRAQIATWVAERRRPKAGQ